MKKYPKEVQKEIYKWERLFQENCPPNFGYVKTVQLIEEWIYLYEQEENYWMCAYLMDRIKNL